MLLQLLAYVLGNIFLAALIALGAWSVQKLARSPELARWLWILAYVKLLTPPIPGWTWQLTATRESCWLGTCHCGAHGLAGLSLSTWIPAAMLGVWGIGLTWHALRLARNWPFQRRPSGSYRCDGRKNSARRHASRNWPDANEAGGQANPTDAGIP